MRIAAPVLGPVWLIALRVLLAGLVLLPLLVQRGQLASLRRHWRPLLLVGCLNAAAPFTLLAYSALQLTAGMTSILNATVPIFAAVIGYAVYAEAFDLRRAVGVLLGFVGVVVLVGLPQNGAPPPLLSVAAGLVAAVSYVFAANIAKHRLSHVPAMVFVTGSQLGAALVLLPLLNAGTRVGRGGRGGGAGGPVHLAGVPGLLPPDPRGRSPTHADRDLPDPGICDRLGGDLAGRGPDAEHAGRRSAHPAGGGAGESQDRGSAGGGADRQGLSSRRGMA